ncbi:MAG: antitoxin component YwqK of YwqJK toxin-antitoxin module [Cyclobacteriaceae bacterium]|jgi:antitoxin component YwqK of YwqJK toxin-antitoxin module
MGDPKKSEVIDGQTIKYHAINPMGIVCDSEKLIFLIKPTPTPSKEGNLILQTSKFIIYKTRRVNNGKTIWSKGKIVANQPEGYWEWYRIEGTKKRSGHFEKGEPVGEWTTYDKEGKVYKVTKK